MTLIVCVADNMGMLFNHRRQSMDVAVRERILRQAEGKHLWMNHYSAKQFSPNAMINTDEAFMNEYCDFMNKYAGSDGTDAGMLNDYANYIDRYAQMVQDFEAWEDDELNAAEEAYYVDVQARVSKRLIETEQLLADMGS